MKVLHVIPSLSPKDGGPSFALPLIARGLVQMDLQVDVVATAAEREIAHFTNQPNNSEYAPPVMCDGVNYFYFRRQTDFYKISFSLAKWLSNHVRGYDLVHIHALFSYSSYAAAHLARKNGVPYIVRPLGVLNRWGLQNRRPLLKRVSLRLIEEKIIRNAAAIHYTSQQERLEAEETVGKKESAVIPLAVELPKAAEWSGPEKFFERFPQARDREVILFLSRLNQKKGLDLLLRAFAEMTADARRDAEDKPLAAMNSNAAVMAGLRPSSFTGQFTKTPGFGQLADVNRLQPLLAIVGDGEKEFVCQLRKLADELGIANDIVWAGFLGGDDKLSAMSAASLFVLPSYSENFGIAPVEAMAAGLPAVISDQVGISAAVREHDAGLVVPCEIGPLSLAMRRLLDDPLLRSQVSGNARRLVNEQFSLEAMNNALVKFYESVLSGGNSSDTAKN